ncbi:hypothetical protein C8R45DRAFT_1103904 [Mycena sanguinolenta]|nr:hypothetical protein C8R45DRAFT_1103904 [Mycena sanguinolenta]
MPLYIFHPPGRFGRTHAIAQFDPLYVFSTSIVAALAQSFLVVRYWLFTKNKLITLTLFFFIIVTAGAAFAGGVTISIFPKYADRGKATIPVIMWVITAAVTDVSIASNLVWEFRKIKSPFKETSSLINRLMAQTIQTGSAGASIALVVLVAFLINQNSNVTTGIAYVLGRIYCITTLANLNSRGIGKAWSNWTTSLGMNFETRGERSDGVIHVDVRRTAVVNVDTPQECSPGSFKTNADQDLPDDSPL